MANCRSPVAVADIFHAARLFAYDRIDVPCCLTLAQRKNSFSPFKPYCDCLLRTLDA